METLKSNIEIADDVFAVIAGIATTGVEGVVSLGQGITMKAMSFIGTNSLKKGVTIEKDKSGKNIKVKISVVLNSNADMKKVCLNIQEKVKEAIESMLDMNVKEVSVRVAKVED